MHVPWIGTVNEINSTNLTGKRETIKLDHIHTVFFFSFSNNNK